MSDTRAYILEDLSKLESKELTLVYKYIRRHLIADIQGLKDPLKEPSLLSTALKTIEAKDKENKSLREYATHKNNGLQPICQIFIEGEKCTCGLDKLLSSPVDKSTDIMSKEINDDK